MRTLVAGERSGTRVAKRGRKPTGKAKTQVGVRLEKELLDRLEAHRKREAQKMPLSAQEKYGISDVIRDCIRHCLDVEEARLSTKK